MPWTSRGVHNVIELKYTPFAIDVHNQDVSSLQLDPNRPIFQFASKRSSDLSFHNICAYISAMRAGRILFAISTLHVVLTGALLAPLSSRARHHAKSKKVMIRRRDDVEEKSRFSYASLTELDTKTLQKLKVQSLSSVQNSGIIDQRHLIYLRNLFKLKVMEKNTV
ncbi:hypothetical protein Plhal304r1_c024g0083051 [Plasmopara halstedii]